MLDNVVLSIRHEEGPVREVYDGCHDYDAGEEGCVVEQLTRKTDERGDIFGGGEAFGSVNFASLCRQEDLAGLHTNIHTFHSPKAQIASRPVQHDCAASVDHVCLKQHFIDHPVVIDNVKFACGKV